ncbi:MAG: Ni/Fe hydrogenase subunit alpha [Desulfohalobiaceae bacterium]|nr:Ni/Fe hydrogenase subunit alpha [Desulfohalobiaceae bacterium]
MSRRISVGALSRIEGEGGLQIQFDAKGRVTGARFNIYEAPRFFESFLLGRSYLEAPDLTARICGICPVAYQMSCVQAMEQALGLRVDEPLQTLRRLLYCGEWMESHALHVFMLHAPDFLGYRDAFEMAGDHPEMVRLGLKLKKLGNRLLACVGGREIHPVNVRVGGFFRTPLKSELQALREDFLRAVEDVQRAVRWIAGFPFPEYSRKYVFVSLSHPEEYPILRGQVRSSGGESLAVPDFEDWVKEHQVAHSTALHSEFRGHENYLLGPMARFNLCRSQLTTLCREAARQAGIGQGTANPFKSILIRAIEILYACEEALRIIEAYERPEQPFVEIEPGQGSGYGCSEAPRGLLYHGYSLDDVGTITWANIIPPTSQNQRAIEQDLREVAEANAGLEPGKLRLLIEQTLRNYDPCISCSTH